MKVECLDGTLLLRPTAQERSRGGVALPDGTVLSDVGELTVVAAGAGYHLPGSGEWFPMDLKVGDVVLLPQEALVNPFDWEGAKCVFVDRRYILAVMERAEPLLSPVGEDLPPSAEDN